MADQPGSGMLHLAAQVVAAHLSNNTVEPSEVPRLIRSVYYTFMNLGTTCNMSMSKLIPAVPIHHSVFPDYIICLENGKKLSALKRYLRVQFGMTPEEYRSKWGLREDYPMVAPNHSQLRSNLAKVNGLGHLPTHSKNVQEIPSVEGLPSRQGPGSTE